MPKHEPDTGGMYLYAVIAGPANGQYGPIGIDDGHVHCISQGAVAAVVSDLKQRALRPQRRHLAAHQRVLKCLMDDGSAGTSLSVLPMSFGVVADGSADIRRVLALNEEVLLERLARVRGRVEMGLRVRWDVPNLFEHLVGRHAELRAARDQAFGGGHEPSYEERMALGRLVDRLLTEDRAVHAAKVTQALRPRCVEISEAKLRDERELANLVCLIERGTEDAFAQSVVEAASLFDANYCFDYNGPWPPHSFVDLNLEL